MHFAKALTEVFVIYFFQCSYELSMLPLILNKETEDQKAKRNLSMVTLLPKGLPKLQRKKWFEKPTKNII